MAYHDHTTHIFLPSIQFYDFYAAIEFRIVCVFEIISMCVLCILDSYLLMRKWERGGPVDVLQFNGYNHF